MPPNTVYVGRGTRWGNPYKIGTCFIPDARAATEAFRANLPTRLECSELTSKNLACWCAVGQPCHADVLLECANV